jgi:hypothetical protein
MSLLDGGLRREVVARLQIDSLIQKNGQYPLKKLVEKRNRGNTHEVPLAPDFWASLSSLEAREKSVVGTVWNERRCSNVSLDLASFPTCSTRHHGGQDDPVANYLNT